jgi:hypothetical protein
MKFVTAGFVSSPRDRVRCGPPWLRPSAGPLMIVAHTPRFWVTRNGGCGRAIFSGDSWLWPDRDEGPGIALSALD